MYKAIYAPISVRAFSTLDKEKCRMQLGPNFNSESLFFSATSAIYLQKKFDYQFMQAGQTDFKLMKGIIHTFFQMHLL